MAIVSFRCPDTQAVFEGTTSRRFSNLRSSLERRLQVLNDATSISDLRSPGNQLEALTKERRGQHSIRVNKQFRLCFVWTKRGPEDVECVDYH